MKKNQSGYSAVEVLIVIIILGLIGTVAWVVYDRQQPKPSNAAPTKSVDSQQAELKGNLSYIKTDEPGDWIEYHQQGSSIYSLTNDRLGCYVAAGVDKPKVDLSGVEPVAGTPNREVTLGSGQKVTIYEIGQSKDYLISEGHIVKDDFNVNVTVACKDKTNYPTADMALKGIRLE